MGTRLVYSPLPRDADTSSMLVTVHLLSCSMLWNHSCWVVDRSHLSCAFFIASNAASTGLDAPAILAQTHGGELCSTALRYHAQMV